MILMYYINYHLLEEKTINSNLDELDNKITLMLNKSILKYE